MALVSPKTAVALGYDDKRRDALVNEKQTLLADVKYRGRTIRTSDLGRARPAGRHDHHVHGLRPDARRQDRHAVADTKGMYGPTSIVPHFREHDGHRLTPFRSDALNGGPGATSR